MSKRENWVWMPHAGHFISGASCVFKLNTYVGGYVVSTVGEWQPSGATGLGEVKQIGLDRMYETMVFKAEREKRPEAKCCPWTMIRPTELDFAGYNDATSAYKGHLKLCKKWSKK